MSLYDRHQSLSSAIGDNKEQYSTSHFSYSKDLSLACWKATSVSPSLKFRLVNFYNYLGSSEDNVTVVSLKALPVSPFKPPYCVLLQSAFLLNSGE